MVRRRGFSPAPGSRALVPTRAWVLRWRSGGGRLWRPIQRGDAARAEAGCPAGRPPRLRGYTRGSCVGVPCRGRLRPDAGGLSPALALALGLGPGAGRTPRLHWGPDTASGLGLDLRFAINLVTTISAQTLGREAVSPYGKRNE